MVTITGTVVVLAEQLDGAIGPTGGRGDEHRLLALVPGRPHALDPVGNPPLVLGRRLAIDVRSAAGGVVDGELRDAARV
jgi:hypothetical protein